MILYLCRHGIAADPSKELSDAARPLTDEGARKFRKAAKGFTSLKLPVTCILSSPLLRAKETADILHDVLAADRKAPKVVLTGALAPPGKFEAFLAEVREGSPAEGIAAVGHEPTMSAWLGKLCFGSSTARCEFKKGAIAAIELDDKAATGALMWLLQPGQLRDLA